MRLLPIVAVFGHLSTTVGLLSTQNLGSSQNVNPNTRTGRMSPYAKPVPICNGTDQTPHGFLRYLPDTSHMGDIATRTRRYLRAVKRYERRAMAQQERVRISDDKRSQGLPDSAPLVSPESPERRRRIIAGRAGLLLAEVPVVALWLEEPVRHLERLPSISIPHHAGGLWEWCLGKPHGWWIRLKQQSQTTIGSWQGKLIPLFVSGYLTWRAAEAKTLYVMIFYAMVLCNLSSVHDWIQWAWERFME